MRDQSGIRQICYLCDGPAKVSKDETSFGRACFYECDACGEYLIDNPPTEIDELKAYKEEEKLVAISAYTRLQYERRMRPDRYKSYILPLLEAKEFPSAPDNFALGYIARITIEDILAQAPRTGADQLDRLLTTVALMTPEFGRRAAIPFNASVLAYTRDSGVLAFKLNQLAGKGYLHPTSDPNHKQSLALLTTDGWDRAIELERGKPGEKPLQVFIAMRFHESMEEAHVNGLAAGIRDAGYEPLRIDSKQHNNKIDDEIIAEIRKSKFVVADFTGQRGGVYYEAGFAHGLGLPVIWTCMEDEIDKCHFDTRQYNHITWKTPEELRDKLRARIEATIGRPPASGHKSDSSL